MSHRLTKFTFDRSELTPEGYLKAPCNATRVGVFPYVQPDGTLRRELRPASEVFLLQSMQTLTGKPITNDHPLTPVNATNSKALSCGFTHEDVEQQDTLLTVSITVLDAGLVAQIMDGKTEVSCGYSCDLDFVAGKYQGEDYDAIQKNIRYNHLAVVPRGRAGPEVRIRLDAAEEILNDFERKDSVAMAKISVGRKQRVEVEVPDTVAPILLQSLRLDEMSMAEMEASITSLQADVQKLLGEKAGLEEGLKNSDEEVKKLSEGLSEEKMDAAIKTRLQIRDVAIKTLEAGKFNLDSMTNKAIVLACVKAKMPALNLDGKSEEFIQGCFGVLSAEPKQAQAPQAPTDRADSEFVDANTARTKMMERASNQWKGTK